MRQKIAVNESPRPHDRGIIDYISGNFMKPKFR